MAGGLAQIVAYGAQDVYLTGQPKVTFFQAVYKRHTNFAMEAIKQNINGTFTNSSKISAVVGRFGDLLGDTWIELPVTTGVSLGPTSTNNGATRDTCWIAERAFTQIDFVIGGNLIDRHYQSWWRLWSECFLDEARKSGYGKMTSFPATTLTGTVILPLLFFFCKNPGLFLPLVALQNHEVRLDLYLTPDFTNYFTGTVNMWSNYVYIDVEERRRLAQGTHEYLIEQVQQSIIIPSTTPTRVYFNHPVKELIWCYQQSGTAPYNMWNFCAPNASGIYPVISCLPASGMIPGLAGRPFINAVTSSSPAWSEDGSSVGTPGAAYPAVQAPLSTFNILFNNQPRFELQSGKYFNQYQPFRYHSGTPYPGIYVYSFALKPEEHQPSGTCNFSRIEKVEVVSTLKSTAGTPNQIIYAVNYNILQVQGGMAALAFSN